MFRFQAALVALLLSAPCAWADEPLAYPQVTGLQVVNTATQEEVGALEEGGHVYSTPNSDETSTDRSIRAEIEGWVTAVKFTVAYVTSDTPSREFTDMTHPYTLCGDSADTAVENESDDIRIFGCPALLPEGTATLSVTPYDGDARGTGSTVSFTIAREAAGSGAQTSSDFPRGHSTLQENIGRSTGTRTPAGPSSVSYSAADKANMCSSRYCAEYGGDSLLSLTCSRWVSITPPSSFVSAYSDSGEPASCNGVRTVSSTTYYCSSSTESTTTERYRYYTYKKGEGEVSCNVRDADCDCYSQVLH